MINNKSTFIRQRGVSFSGFLMVSFALILFSVLGLKVVPAYMQNMEIKKIFDKISNDPEMYKAPPHQIRASFDRRAAVDDIKFIKSDDLDIESNEGKPVLSASYSVKVPLVANVSLSLDFNPQSAH